MGAQTRLKVKLLRRRVETLESLVRGQRIHIDRILKILQEEGLYHPLKFPSGTASLEGSLKALKDLYPPPPPAPEPPKEAPPKEEPKTSVDVSGLYSSMEVQRQAARASVQAMRHRGSFGTYGCPEVQNNQKLGEVSPVGLSPAVQPVHSPFGQPPGPPIPVPELDLKCSDQIG